MSAMWKIESSARMAGVGRVAPIAPRRLTGRTRPLAAGRERPQSGSPRGVRLITCSASPAAERDGGAMNNKTLIDLPFPRREGQI
jgi:hypothetical protein